MRGIVSQGIASGFVHSQCVSAVHPVSTTAKKLGAVRRVGTSDSRRLTNTLEVTVTVVSNAKARDPYHRVRSCTAIGVNTGFEFESPSWPVVCGNEGTRLCPWN